MFFDKQIIGSTFNHVMVFTLIKIIFMLQIILKLLSPSYEVSDLKVLPFNMLSSMQIPHICYYMIISIPLNIQVTLGLDATFILFFYMWISYLCHNFFFHLFSSLFVLLRFVNI